MNTLISNVSDVAVEVAEANNRQPVSVIVAVVLACVLVGGILAYTKKK